jgi:hypothetical protein
MQRANWTCANCGHRDPGNQARGLDAHHTERVLELRDPFDLRWIEVLCDRCHGGVR